MAQTAAPGGQKQCRGPGVGKTRGFVVPSADRELSLYGQGFGSVAGVDEAGRGCLAGPVVAAAVVFPRATLEGLGALTDVRDSKTLAASTRETLFELIWTLATAVAVGISSVQVIECQGIVAATKMAMRSAIQALPFPADFLLLDYLTIPDLDIPQEGIVHGDALCLSIAAASIVAKVSRDHLMLELDRLHPGYGFAAHKGYGTPRHLAALERLGPGPFHRKTFAPVRAVACGNAITATVTGMASGERE